MKKIISLFLAVSMVALLFTSCGKNKTPNKTDTSADTIRFLNFKPEVAPVYEKIAEAYKKETGKTLIVETAASGNYEQTLAAKMGTKEGYLNWKDYCADLKNTELYKHLKDKSLAVTSNGNVYGIPYVLEGYGIIYNKEITDKYFALENPQLRLKQARIGVGRPTLQIFLFIMNLKRIMLI